MPSEKIDHDPAREVRGPDMIVGRERIGQLALAPDFSNNVDNPSRGFATCSSIKVRRAQLREPKRCNRDAPADLCN